MAITRKISNSGDVKAAIKELELKLKVQESGMKNQFADVKQNLTPRNLLSNTFSYLAETPEIQKTVVNTAIGFIVGFASKKAMEYLQTSDLNRSVESLVSSQLTKIENQQPDSVVAKGLALFRKFTPPTSPIYPFLQSR